MSDNDSDSNTRTNTNASFTPGQLNLGLLVDNAGDELFEQTEPAEDMEDHSPRNNVTKTFREPRTVSQPQLNYNVVNNDDLESMHGDKSVVMSDDDESFPRSSSDDDDNFSKASRSRYSSSDDGGGGHEDNTNKRRKMYMQIRGFCKRKGLDFPSHLHQESPYKDLKSYLSMLRSEQQMEQSVEMCKKVIVGVTSVFEYMNTRFDPIGLKLDGYSESVSDQRDDLTEPLEELYEKHSDKFDMPPEVKIMMIIGGAAAQTHIMNSMSGSKKPQEQPVYHSNPSTQHKPVQQPQASYSQKTVSDPAMDDDKDIQDILREMHQSSDTRSNASLSSSGTNARRARGNKRISLDDF